jgi:2-polyprenyl-3-methyl-5-hydroxy-6-metoxy-1,4-benzoquinol methylase
MKDNPVQPVANGLKPSIKRLAHGMFGLFGLRVQRIQKPRGGERYHHGLNLTPLQHNSRDLYERFYSDDVALEEYFTAHRLSFYTAVSNGIREAGLGLDGKDVLDVGCGTGHLLSEVGTWSKPRSINGCDFSDASIKLSRERFPEGRFFRHDIYDPLPDSYDVVLCTEVVEHLERPFIALKNLLRAVRLGGAMVLTVPNGRLDTAIEHLNFWSPESWKIFVERECPGCSLETATLLENRFNFALVRPPPGPHSITHPRTIKDDEAE